MLKPIIIASIILCAPLIYANNTNQITNDTDEKYTHNKQLHSDIEKANPKTAKYYENSSKNPQDGYGQNADASKNNLNKKSNIPDGTNKNN